MKARLEALRAEMARQGLDGFIVPHADEFQNEYLPPSAERLAWITGFTGSAGTAVILKDKAAVFTDGRYTIQIREQVDAGLFDIRHITDEPPKDWVAEHLGQGGRLGYDPWLHTERALDVWRKAAEKAGGELVAVEHNPLDAVWADRPAAPAAPVAPHGKEFAGETSASKRERVAKSLGEAGADSAVITAPDSIAWLLNIRGGDVAHTPLPLSFAILYATGRVEWFVDPAKVGPDLAGHLGDEVTVRNADEFEPALWALGNNRVLADPAATAALVFERLGKAGAQVVRADDPCQLPKACKNTVEIEGMRAAHRRDGAALTRFLAWLGKQIIFRPLVNQIGFLRLRRAYTGGAALGPELFTFYQAIGVNLKQIYGQTEIVGIAYMHRDGDIRPDTVGKPLPGTECRISDEGEILSRSASVTPGYYNLPEKTAELLEGGWLHSGDAGYIDANGHLVVIDRISDVMHTQEGKMFSPMFLENRLKFSPYIKEAVIFGNKKEYVAALINVDPIVVGKWAEDRGISFSTYMELSNQPEVAELIKGAVLEINQNSEKPHFKIRRFSILYKLLDMDDGELTKTGKIRRKFVREKYDDLYEALYDEDVSEKTVEAFYQYQDGQTTTVETTIRFYTMEEL
ncbi:MAG: aminopeptidase P family N-terminal domain-containing protein [Pseudomonadota bacterium]